MAIRGLALGALAALAVAQNPMAGKLAQRGEEHGAPHGFHGPPGESWRAGVQKACAELPAILKCHKQCSGEACEACPKFEEDWMNEKLAKDPEHVEAVAQDKCNKLEKVMACRSECKPGDFQCHHKCREELGGRGWHNLDKHDKPHGRGDEGWHKHGDKGPAGHGEHPGHHDSWVLENFRIFTGQVAERVRALFGHSSAASKQLEHGQPWTSNLRGHWPRGPKPIDHATSSQPAMELHI